MPNSELIFDECGVCGGDNSTCILLDISIVPNAQLYYEIFDLKYGNGYYGYYYDNNILYNVTEDHSNTNDFGLPNYFSPEWHEDFDLYPNNDENLDGVEDWINLESIYPSYTKLFLSDVGTPGYLNSMDFIIKHNPNELESLNIETYTIALPLNTEELCNPDIIDSFFDDINPTTMFLDIDMYADGENVARPDKYSMCYSYDNDNSHGGGFQPYYIYSNIGSYANPEWVQIENPAFDMNELAVLDLPHDGMGEFDKFDVLCDEFVTGGGCETYFKGQILVNDSDQSCSGDTNYDGCVCCSGDDGISYDELLLVDESYSHLSKFYFDIELWEYIHLFYSK